MCGLWGVTTSVLSKQEILNTFQLGVMSQLRGTDSTGIIVAGREGNTRKLRNTYRALVAKETYPAGYFLLTKEAALPFKEINIPTAIVGHCRSATIGDVTVDNAHPFEHGDIVGVHNGTLVGTLADEARKIGITDSEMFFRELSSSTLQLALNKCGYNSAYAFVWVDKQANTLNLLRNSRRPLYLMYDKDKTTTYWASEKGMLNLLAERENPTDFCAPYMLKDDVHVVIELGDNACVNIPDVKPKYVAPAMVPYKPADDKWWSTMYSKPEEKQYTKRTFKPKVEDEIPWIDDGQAKHPKDHLYYKGYEHMVVPVRVVRPRLAVGCTNCMSKCGPEDTVHWLSRDAYLCDDCINLDFVKENFKVGALNKTYPGGIYTLPGFVKDKVLEEKEKEVDPNMQDQQSAMEKPTCH